MLWTLLFYLTFALGEACLVVWAINVIHGSGLKSRWLEHGTIAALALLGLASLESTRRWWLVPVELWPLPLKLAAGLCCAIALVGLPFATFLRWRRREPEGIRRTDEHFDLVGDGPRERFMGSGHRWVHFIPGNQAFDLTLHRWSVAPPGLPVELEGLSILHLTDLHFSRAYDFSYFEAAFEAASRCRPALVLITGDLIDDTACIAWIRPLFERLPATLGRFAILGNHDHHHDTGAIMRAATDAGYTVLDGEVTSLEVNGRQLAIGGTCSPWGPAIPDDAIPAADFRLLMSHTPDLAYTASRQGWDLMLCGHNHGGQVCLPIIGPALMPSRFSRRFDAGFYRVDPTLMYVSRGLGAKHPLRISCPPEISHFTLAASRESALRSDGPGTPHRSLACEATR